MNHRGTWCPTCLVNQVIILPHWSNQTKVLIFKLTYALQIRQQANLGSAFISRSWIPWSKYNWHAQNHAEFLNTNPTVLVLGNVQLCFFEVSGYMPMTHRWWRISAVPISGLIMLAKLRHPSPLQNMHVAWPERSSKGSPIWGQSIKSPIGQC